MSPAAFLPGLHNCNGAWSDVCKSLYGVFEADLKKHRSRHDGKDIIYDSRVLPDGDGLEEAFWHLIQQDDRVTGQRVFDPSRAEKLPWLRPTAETTDAAITVFDYDTGNSKKGIRRYVWIKNDDYVVVLKHQRRVFFLVTAYHVERSGAKTLQKHYDQRLGI